SIGVRSSRPVSSAATSANTSSRAAPSAGARSSGRCSKKPSQSRRVTCSKLVPPASWSSERPRTISRPASPSTSDNTVSAAMTPSNPSDMTQGFQIALAPLQKSRHSCLVKIDQYNQYMSAKPPLDWIAAEDARGRLGVRPQTLYAYVSRGRVQVRPDPHDPRRSLYRAADIAALAQRKARSRKVSEVAAGA